MKDKINRVESVLFSSGRKLSLSELRRLAKVRKEEDIKQAIESLKERYKETSIAILDEDDGWKMTVKQDFIPYIRKLVTDTEISKTLMETLAVVAWKNPAMQSDIIKIRTNKAYDHLRQLEDAGFIKSEKQGRTRVLRLTTKFYEYFDVESDKEVKEMFNDLPSKMPGMQEQDEVSAPEGDTDGKE
ncbi:MAG: SMC-Scp complex subunit ScpB [Nanobdellota archaeon]